MAILGWGSCRQISALKPKEELPVRQVKENLEIDLQAAAPKAVVWIQGDELCGIIHQFRMFVQELNATLMTSNLKCIQGISDVPEVRNGRQNI